MIKMTYSGVIVKQEYHKNSDGSLSPYFEESAIGVLHTSSLYALDENDARAIIDGWNESEYYEYNILDIDIISINDLPDKCHVHVYYTPEQPRWNNKYE